MRLSRSTLRTLSNAILHPRLFRLIRKVRARRLSYLTDQALLELAQVVKRAPEGDIVEAGVALGGSAIVMAAVKRPEATLHLFDMFGMIPAPSLLDGPDGQRRYQSIVGGESAGIGEDQYYGYRPDLSQAVVANLATFGYETNTSAIRLIPGLFSETLHVEKHIAVAHIDCDWYESVWVALERLSPWIVEGGTLVIDDYFTWSGARAAVDSFFDGRSGWRFESRSRLHIVRVSGD